MTLNTRIYITSPADHLEVFNKVNDLFNIPASRVTTVGGGDDPAIFEIENQLGQGFDAWLMSSSRCDGAPIFPSEEDVAEYEEDECTPWPAHFIKISMDTGYAYTGPSGESCTMLHARVIFELGLWLQEKGITWVWQNEYTGEYFDGFDGLESFLSHGDAAGAWFQHTVLPTLGSMGLTKM